MPHIIANKIPLSYVMLEMWSRTHGLVTNGCDVYNDDVLVMEMV